MLQKCWQQGRMPALQAVGAISEAGYVQHPDPLTLCALRWPQVRACMHAGALTPPVGSQGMLQRCWRRGSMPALQAVGAISEAGYVQHPDLLI